MELLQTLEANHILGQKFLNNSMLDYLLAVFLAVVLWLVLAIVKRYGLRKASQIAAWRSPMLAGLIDRIQSGISSLIIPAISVYAALHRLELNPKFDRALDVTLLFILTIQGSLLLVRIADYFVMHLTFGRDAHDLSVNSARRNLKAILMSVIWIAAGLFFLSNIGIDIATFVTGLGIGGIAVALAVQSVLGDVLSSFSISIDKPFEIGDFVVIDGFSGTVELIGLKSTRIRSLNGELLVFGNQDLTNSRIQNYKRMETRRILFKLGIVYSTPLERVREVPAIVKEIIENQKELRFDRCHFLEFGDSSLNFEVVYIVNNRDYNVYCDYQQAINLTILDEFEKREIGFAFPTQSIHVETLPPLVQRPT